MNQLNTLDSLIILINTVRKNRGRSEVGGVSGNSHLRSDIGFDSLDLAELTVRIEAAYNVDIFEDGIVNTVGEILQKLDNK
jgi:acyl carrier protein